MKALRKIQWNAPFPAWVGWTIVLVLLAFNIYRATHTLITADEGTSRRYFVDTPWTNFTTNNQIVNTYLMWVAIHSFGELAYRLFPLIAGFFFMWGAKRFPWWVFLLLVLNPLQLDYMVLARGYGYGSAGLLWGIIFLKEKKIELSALCLGFAVASNFTFAFPVAGLMLTKLSLRWYPAGVVFGAFWLPVWTQVVHGPVSTWGLESMMWSMQNVSACAVGERLQDVGVIVFLIVLYFAWRSQEHVVCQALVWTTALLLAAHLFKGVPFPADRTGIFFFTLVFVAAGELSFTWVSFLLVLFLINFRATNYLCDMTPLAEGPQHRDTKIWHTSRDPIPKLGVQYVYHQDLSPEHANYQNH